MSGGADGEGPLAVRSPLVETTHIRRPQSKKGQKLLLTGFNLLLLAAELCRCCRNWAPKIICVIKVFYSEKRRYKRVYEGGANETCSFKQCDYLSRCFGLLMGSNWVRIVYLGTKYT